MGYAIKKKQEEKEAEPLLCAIKDFLFLFFFWLVDILGIGCNYLLNVVLLS